MKRSIKSVNIWILCLSLFGTSLLYNNCTGQGFTSLKGADSNNSQGTGDLPNSSGVWIVPNISFTQGSTQTFDLSQTFPNCLAGQGIFGIDPSGTKLPAGMSLSSGGILSVGSAVVADTPGVIFNCTQP